MICLLHSKIPELMSPWTTFFFSFFDQAFIREEAYYGWHIEKKNTLYPPKMRLYKSRQDLSTEFGFHNDV